MKQQTTNKLFSILLLIMLPFSAQAHNVATLTYSFTDGFVHPWFGVDHILALSAIGFWAGLAGKRTLWLLPGCFMIAMIIGALLNFSGLVLNDMEIWVSFSVLLLGVLLFSNAIIPIALAATTVTAMALGHGYVHAAEISSNAHAPSYALGFLAATACLHGIGILAALSCAKIITPIRAGFGLFCTVTGMVLLTSV